MPKRVSYKLRLASRKLSPRHVSRQLRTAHIVRNFVEQIGLVYFGTVTSESGRAATIKGLTVSTSYFDRHFSVGSYRGYDMALTVRRDSVDTGRDTIQDYAWTVLRLSLQVRNDLDPLFVIHREMLAVYRSKFLAAQPLPPLQDSEITRRFTERFALFGAIARRSQIHQMLNDQMLADLLYQTQKYSFELSTDELYVYLPVKYPGRKELTWLISFGVWLAQTIDHAVTDQQ